MDDLVELQAAVIRAARNEVAKHRLVRPSCACELCEAVDALGWIDKEFRETGVTKI
jgi:hypothetical protein